MNSEELTKLVKEAAVEVDGKQKLSCAKILQLAEKHSVSPGEIGECCNQNKIKIFNCQIGCFK